jgi:hypothetical protein
MISVLDKDMVPLMPCSEKRARKLMEKKEAKAYWKNGVFCIILRKEPSARNYQDVVIGIDPGSKRTGITTATEKKVICNQIFDTPRWVKKNVESRKTSRRSRRYRKTPYRKCRSNRSIGGVPPSTKARWGVHLRIIDFWKKLIPLTVVSLEDIKAEAKKNCRKWNKNFSPLEVGKLWFEEEVEFRGYKLYKFQGFETKSQRNYRGFKKTSQKLKDCWDAHNVDSHCLCELAVGNIKPFFGVNKCELFQWSRRQLHVSNFQKGGIRKQYGTTRSLGVNRGTLVKHVKFGLTYIGGSSKGKLSLHDIKSGSRLCQNAKKEDCEILTNLRWRTQIPPKDKSLGLLCVKQ